MRVFVAIDLPPTVRHALREVLEPALALGPSVRWTKVENVHLTLRFLGSISPDALPRIQAELKQALSTHGALQLRLEGLGAFPRLTAPSPRVLWCGLGGDLDGLRLLQRRVEQACVEAGIAPETRPFRPHLTLGRVRSKRNLQHVLDYIRMARVPRICFEAERIHIFKSTLTPQGPVYEKLETIALEE